MDNVNRLESMHCLYKDRSSLDPYITAAWSDDLESFGYCFLLYSYNPTTCCVNSEVR